MRSISDELRKWCNLCGGIIDSDDKAELHALVDCIDSEMVELPQSADGKFWTGREVCFWTGATQDDYHLFDSICLSNGRWSVEDTSYRIYAAESVWYERPDSLERIADDLDEMVDSAGSADDRCEKLANLAERIRRLADCKQIGMKGIEKDDSDDAD